MGPALDLHVNWRWTDLHVNLLKCELRKGNTSILSGHPCGPNPGLPALHKFILWQVCQIKNGPYCNGHCPRVASDALRMFDDEIRLCFAPCAAIEVPIDVCCPKSLCPNTTVIYSCNMPSLNSQLGYTKWSFGTIVGNCPVGNIALRQPIFTHECTEQIRTCGKYTGSMFIPCTMTSLAVMITQDLNGTIIQCLNIDTLGFKNAPGTPNINIAKDCNSLSVGWVPSSSGDPAISFAVHIQGHGTDQEVTVMRGPATTSISVGAPSKQWYNLRVSGSPFVNINKSCSGSTCYFKIDTTTHNIPPPYSVEVAAISNGQMGPYSLLLKSAVGDTTAEVSSQDSNHVTVKCTFYDGFSHYCLLCCSTDPSVQVSAYSNVSSSSGPIAYVDLYGLKPGAVYYCKAFATNDVNKKFAAFKRTVTNGVAQFEVNIDQNVPTHKAIVVAGISVAVTFVESFSLGAVMAIICVHLYHISRQKYRKCDINISSMSTDFYDVVGSKKTEQCIVKMDVNTSYGVSLSSHQTDI
ncbi:hypothetical protein EMCRGX_G015563 [Ephydatia muelleri]